HTYFTIPGSQVLVDRVRIESYQDDLSFHLLVNTALENTGYHDSAYAFADLIEFRESQTRLSVRATTGFAKTSVGYVGISDGWRDLATDFSKQWQHNQAINGNVAGMAKLLVPPKKGTYEFFVTYSFEGTQQFTQTDLNEALKSYEDGWNTLLDQYNSPNFSSPAHEELYKRSIFTLRVHEDKVVRGAMIASLSKPWGDELY